MVYSQNWSLSLISTLIKHFSMFFPVLFRCIAIISFETSKKIGFIFDEKTTEKINYGWKAFLKTISNLKFLIPFGLNQSGSLLYYFLLGKISIYKY